MGRGSIGFRIVLNLFLLNVQGQVNQDRPGPALPHDLESLAENPGHHGRILDTVRLLGDRLDHLCDVHRLEGLPIQLSPHILAGEGQNGNRVHLCGVEPCDEVAGSRTRCGRTHPYGSEGPGVAVGHVDGAFLVAGHHVFDGPQILQRSVEGENPRTGYPKDVLDALALKNSYSRRHCRHLSHSGSPLLLRMYCRIYPPCLFIGDFMPFL